MTKLYKVRESALAPHAPYSTSNKAFVNQHGWLWVREVGDKYRSVATGGTANWLTSELERLKNG